MTLAFTSALYRALDLVRSGKTPEYAVATLGPQLKPAQARILLHRVKAALEARKRPTGGYRRD